MILLPVIERELRAAARQGLTYNLRVLGALALMMVLGMFWLHGFGGPGAGGMLFNELHRTLFFAIWIFVPILTADCLSRERREGTLPLLFLTPLRAWHIVSAKGLAHGLRSFTLWLAVLPVFTISFLAGGVDWRQVVMSALVNFSAVCLALGAGLLASSRTRVWTRALGWAGFLGFGLLSALLVLLPAIMGACWGATTGTHTPLNWSDVFPGPEAGLGMAIDIQSVAEWRLFKRSPGLFLAAYAVLACLSALILYVLTRLTAWEVNRTWQEKPASPRALWWRKVLLEPVLFRKQLQSWLRWELRRNPIGWLERRSWSGRLVVWTWFAIVTCVYSSLFANLTLYQRAFHGLQCVLATLLAGSMALSAAGSFRRERETGVLELLLVAPLREGQIIAGRVRGLWAQFLPAIILLSVVWLYGATFLSHLSEVPSVLGYAVTFATLPVVGLYFSLAKPNFIAALIWTLLAQLLLPEAVLVITRLYEPDASDLLDLVVQASVQIAVAAFLGWRLLALLKGRRFVRTGS